MWRYTSGTISGSEGHETMSSLTLSCERNIQEDIFYMHSEVNQTTNTHFSDPHGYEGDCDFNISHGRRRTVIDLALVALLVARSACTIKGCCQTLNMQRFLACVQDE